MAGGRKFKKKQNRKWPLKSDLSNPCLWIWQRLTIRLWSLLHPASFPISLSLVFLKSFERSLVWFRRQHHILGAFLSSFTFFPFSFNLPPPFIPSPCTHTHILFYQSVPLFSISLLSYISLFFSPSPQSISIQSCISSFLWGVEQGESWETTRGRCCTNQCLLPDWVHKDKGLLSPLCLSISLSLPPLYSSVEFCSLFVSVVLVWLIVTPSTVRTSISQDRYLGGRQNGSKILMKLLQTV